MPSSSPEPVTTIWKQGTRVKDGYVGSPGAALRDLPEGLYIDIGTPTGSDAANTLTLDQVKKLRRFCAVHVGGLAAAAAAYHMDRMQSAAHVENANMAGMSCTAASAG